MRESCYNCNFKDGNYYSDITLSDFWGVEKCLPQYNDDKGVSAVIVNTAKGSLALENAKGLIITETNFFDVIKENTSYVHSAQRNMFRDRALTEIKTKGVSKTVEKYCGKSLMSKIRRKVVKILYQR